MLNDLYQMLDPVAFTVGPFSARWYGIAYVVGFLLGMLVIYRVAKRWKLGFNADDVMTILVAAMLGVIIGARLGYVLFYNFDFYAAHPLEIVNFSHGGMSFHGGFIGAVLGGVVAARVIHMPFLSLFDVAVIGAPLGLLFGRCANFVNGELWGAPTDLPWGVVFGGSAGLVSRHPSQLYEALLEGVVLFAILYLMSRKRPPFPRGMYAGTFMVGYGVARIVVEFVRQPDVQLGYLLGTDWLTMGMVLSLPLVAVGIGLIVYACLTKHPQSGPAQAAEGECP